MWAVCTFLSADFKVNRRYQDISTLMLPENEAWSRTSTAPLTFHDASPPEVSPSAAFPMYTEMASLAFSSCCEASEPVESVACSVASLETP